MLGVSGTQCSVNGSHLVNAVALGLPRCWVGCPELLLVMIYGRFILPTGLPQL